jgi:hypothetical protein
VLITLSGSGTGTWAPFIVSSSVVTAHCSYNCSALGDTGNPSSGHGEQQPGQDRHPSYDDQPIASLSGSGGSQTTTLHPTKQGSSYYLAVDSPCSWIIKLTGSSSGSVNLG